jgi:glycosyltransferase involved in cell wall biosynthesis
MRIRMVVPSLVAGGMEMSVIQLCAEFAEQGHDVRIVSLDGVAALDQYAQQMHVSVDHVNVRGLRSLLLPSSLSRYFAREAVDVVHSHNGAWSRALAAAVFAGVPARVHTMHGFHEREAEKLKWMERAAVPMTSAIAVVSEELSRHAKNTLWASPYVISAVTNGVPVNVTERDDCSARERFGFDATHRIVVTAGRLVPVKAHAVLIDAFANVVEQVPEARLIIVGEGPEREALERAIAERRLQGVVLLTGHRSDVGCVLRACDVFCLPSHSEGLSISLLEAMASGLPVVATAVGSTPDVVTPETGLLVPPANPAALAKALVSLLTQPERRAAMSDAAKARVRDHYSISRTATQYLALYQSALARTRRASN